ncbi:hypothetical protein EJB05_48253, partial [Eragrostis curvula]
MSSTLYAPHLVEQLVKIVMLELCKLRLLRDGRIQFVSSLEPPTVGGGKICASLFVSVLPQRQCACFPHIFPGLRFCWQEPVALNHLVRRFTSQAGGDSGNVQKPFIAFVLGGPGSGKGTQCTKIASNFGFTHLSDGDLLRHEISSDTEKGESILEIIKEGRIVPSEVTVELIRKAMEMSNAKRVLIGGFPSLDGREGNDFGHSSV